jgi:hypothetical protein
VRSRVGGLVWSVVFVVGAGAGYRTWGSVAAGAVALGGRALPPGSPRPNCPLGPTPSWGEYGTRPADLSADPGGLHYNGWG